MRQNVRTSACGSIDPSPTCATGRTGERKVLVSDLAIGRGLAGRVLRRLEVALDFCGAAERGLRGDVVHFHLPDTLPDEQRPRGGHFARFSRQPRRQAVGPPQEAPIVKVNFPTPPLNSTAT